MTFLGREQVYLNLIKEKVLQKFKFESGKYRFVNISLLILK